MLFPVRVWKGIRYCGPAPASRKFHCTKPYPALGNDSDKIPPVVLLMAVSERLLMMSFLPFRLSWRSNKFNLPVPPPLCPPPTKILVCMVGFTLHFKSNDGKAVVDVPRKDCAAPFRITRPSFVIKIAPNELLIQFPV